MLDRSKRSASGRRAAVVGERGLSRLALERLGPHVWTVAPRLRQVLRPIRVPPSEPWQAVVEDPTFGPVKLTGRLRRRPADASDGGAPGHGELVVLVHGLGGSIDSHYMLRGALAAEAAGLACLRLNLRGADYSGEDFYHAGLSADLHAALASPELRAFERIHVLGYSMGGHLVLRFASEPGDPRVARVAAVCAPLDLAHSQAALDSPERWLYRRYLMSNLARLYAKVAVRRSLPLPVAEVERIRKLREFDERVVAPRHGFAGAEDYYAKASVAPRLGQLRVPSLLVHAEGDPMVAASAVRPALDRSWPRLEVRWVTGGGHVGFPSGIDLELERGAHGAREDRGGLPAPRRIDDQVLAWLRRA